MPLSVPYGAAAVSPSSSRAGTGLWDQAMLINTAEPASIEYRKAFGKSMPVGACGNTYDDACWPQNEGQKKFYKAWYDYTGENEPPSKMASSGYYILHGGKGHRKAGTDENGCDKRVGRDDHRHILGSFDHFVILRSSGHLRTDLGATIEEPGSDTWCLIRAG